VISFAASRTFPASKSSFDFTGTGLVF